MHTTSNSGYSVSIAADLTEIGQLKWDALVSSQSDANPFLSFAFLHALQESQSASPLTGWQGHYLSLWQGEQLCAAMPLYLKSHSYGEYVFDWAWADAYRHHGYSYYPKFLSAIPFTPVTGNRLLAIDSAARKALLDTLVYQQRTMAVSSTHVLFAPLDEIAALAEAGFLSRSAVQFHWPNKGYIKFDDFLGTLEHKKRKNILAERRKVREAGVHFHQLSGHEASLSDWQFFQRCYEQTYADHGASPYLSLAFFRRLGETMPQNIRLIMAARNGQRIASSLLIYDKHTLYGRYWGCLETVSCLHFETAYYQALEFCISTGIQTFEGGAQGEHKLARGFLPHRTLSAHWLKHPAFANAIADYLQRETDGIEHYFDELNEHSPYSSK